MVYTLYIYNIYVAHTRSPRVALASLISISSRDLEISCAMIYLSPNVAHFSSPSSQIFLRKTERQGKKREREDGREMSQAGSLNRPRPSRTVTLRSLAARSPTQAVALLLFFCALRIAQRRRSERGGEGGKDEDYIRARDLLAAHFFFSLSSRDQS